MNHLRVLIVDDEPAILLSLEFLLGRAGFQTDVACDGAEALQKAATFQPHLILLDLMLPRLSGLDVCRALRTDTALRHTKILMLTAQGSAADHAEAMAAGADSYQVKPFSTRDLLTEVRRLLEVEDAVHGS